jgi:hypothetical protein
MLSANGLFSPGSPSLTSSSCLPEQIAQREGIDSSSCKAALERLAPRTKSDPEKQESAMSSVCLELISAR